MKKKALFLDRDGVINHDKADGSFTFLLDDFILLPDVKEVLKQATALGYILVIITNQSGIGRGIYSHDQVRTIHANLTEELKADGISVAAIYYCPHHPVSSNCICRKPDSVLLEKAITRFNIDPEQSVMVGDRERDILAAHKAGVTKTLLIETNSSLKQVLPLL